MLAMMQYTFRNGPVVEVSEALPIIQTAYGRVDRWAGSDDRGDRHQSAVEVVVAICARVSAREVRMGLPVDCRRDPAIATQRWFGSAQCDPAPTS